MSQKWGDMIFNGVSLYENYGLIFGTPEDVLFPKWRERKQNIPGRNGRYDYGSVNHEERPYRIKCISYRKLNRSELRELAYLLSKKSTIRNWDEPDKYYVGQLMDAQSLQRLTADRDGNGRIGLELEFTCEPFALGETKEIPIRTGINKPDYKGTAETPTLFVLKNNSTTAAQLIQIKAVFRR